MKRIMMVLSVAALMGAMTVASALPAFADSYEEQFLRGYYSCLADPACYMADTPALQTDGSVPFAVNDPSECPAGTTWAPTSDPKYGGAQYVCE